MRALAVRQREDVELVALRTLLADIATAARWGDVAEVRRLLGQHAGNTHARRGALLASVLVNPKVRWKSGRAVTALRRAGYHPVSIRTAAGDLVALSQAGHLIRHQDKSVVWYEPTAGDR